MRFMTDRGLRDLRATEYARGVAETRGLLTRVHDAELVGVRAGYQHIIDGLNDELAASRALNEKAQGQIDDHDGALSRIRDLEAALDGDATRTEVYRLQRLVRDHADRLAELTAADQARDVPVVAPVPEAEAAS